MPPIALTQALLIGALALPLVACVVNPATEPAAATTPPQAVVAANGEDALICQSYASTASRVRREKVCMTAKQWNAANEDAENYTRSLQNSGSAQPGGQLITSGP